MAVSFGSSASVVSSFSQPLSYELNSFITESARNFSTTVLSGNAELSKVYNRLTEKFTGSEAMRTLKAFSRQFVGAFGSNDFRPISDIGSMQNAPDVMQRYIMANPTVRQLYIDGRVDGYSETYVDNTNKVGIGRDHYDYRKVTNGYFMEKESGVTNYYHLPEDNDTPLTLKQQEIILETWHNLDSMLDGDEDPTDIWNGLL